MNQNVIGDLFRFFATSVCDSLKQKMAIGRRYAGFMTGFALLNNNTRVAQVL